MHLFRASSKADISLNAPPVGASTPITGTLSGPASFSNVKAVVFVADGSGAWWGPKAAAPLTSAGEFVISSWATDPNDVTAPAVLVAAFPITFEVPTVLGVKPLPPAISAQAISQGVATRSATKPAPAAPVAMSCVPCAWPMGPPGAKISNGASLQFAGYDWDIKDSGGAAVGPGPNVFDPSLAFTDGHGMHLNLRPRSGCAGWASSEVLLSRSLGYGTYLFSVVGPAQTLDAQCVFGAFLWDDNAAPGYREIDFEFARWGNPGDPTAAQFVLEPLRSNKLPAWRVRYPLGAAARYSEAQPDGPAEEVNRLTCALVWGPGRLEWYCWDGLWTLATVGQATVSMVGLYTNARGF